MIEGEVRMRILVCMLLAALPAFAQSGAPAAASAATNQPRQQRDQLSARGQERIQREVLHELNMLPNYRIFDILNYQVQGSTVVLGGKVHSLGLKKDAEDAVRHIEGVENVVNNIQVLNTSPFDDKLRVAIARELFNSPALFKYSMGALPPIHIIVDKAHVTLEGTVDNEGDKNIAGIKAQGVPGVMSLTNNLQIAK